MAFGYTLLKGRGGTSGHIRETDGKREISVRGLPPGSPCALYAWEDGVGVPQDERKTDGDGNARLTAVSPGRVFVAAAGRVMLWEGEEDAYLAASAWLKQQNKRPEEKKELKNPAQEKPDAAHDSPEEKKAPEAEKPSDILLAETALLRDAAQPAKEREAAPSPPSSCQQEKETPPEQAYTLRPAGTGEPVDALPERPRRY